MQGCFIHWWTGKMSDTEVLLNLIISGIGYGC